MDNANPVVYATQALQPRNGELDAISNSTQWWRDDRLAPHTTLFDSDEDSGEEREEDSDVKPESMDAREVFDLVRSITDPEHPLTLEQLAVVKEEHITVDEGDVNAERSPQILLEFTPTIPHCSMATLIGLSLRVRLLRALPSRYKVTIRIREGTHQSENAINKQLQDKERVAAALENKHLLGVVQGCLATSALRGTGSTDMAQVSPLLST